MALGNVALLGSLLLIGDSHLVGPMGRELVARIHEGSSAQVSVNASCGATPSYFFNESVSKCGTWQAMPDLPEIDSTKPFAAVNLDMALNHSQAEHVVISLGTNLATRCKTGPCYSDTEVTKQILEFLSPILDVRLKCSWILIPPVKYIPGLNRISEKRAERVNELIRELAGPHCTIISPPATLSYPPKNGDGIHYFGKRASEWALSILEQLK